MHCKNTGVGDLPMKHDPLCYGDNALLSLVEGGKLGFHGVVCVCHRDTSSRLGSSIERVAML